MLASISEWVCWVSKTSRTSFGANCIKYRSKQLLCELNPTSSAICLRIGAGTNRNNRAKKGSHIVLNTLMRGSAVLKECFQAIAASLCNRVLLERQSHKGRLINTKSNFSIPNEKLAD